MFKFIQNVIAKREAKKEYQEKLIGFLADDILSTEEKKELDIFLENNNIKHAEVLGMHKEAVRGAYLRMIENNKVTEEERKNLENLLNHFNIGKEDIRFDEELFKKYFNLNLINEGQLPTVINDQEEIMFKKDEIIHYFKVGELKKLKKVTTRINYSGPVASVRIMKGLRYRAGSVRVSTQSSEFFVTEDTGVFWLTNQHVGFKGIRKNFAFPYEKISSFQLTTTGIVLTKEGKETPYTISLEDYDIPCSIISYIINSKSN